MLYFLFYTFFLTSLLVFAGATYFALRKIKLI